MNTFGEIISFIIPVSSVIPILLTGIWILNSGKDGALLSPGDSAACKSSEIKHSTNNVCIKERF